MNDMWPTKLTLNRAEKILSIGFDNGTHFDLSCEYLRTQSPSAEVQGHGPAQRLTVGGKRTVAISAIEPIGNYAVRLVFDDGHSTGLYSWAYLWQLGTEYETRWQNYLSELAKKNLSRDV